MTSTETALRTAAAALAVRLDEIGASASFRGVFTIAAIHGAEYQGATWSRELDALKAALAASDDDTR